MNNIESCSRSFCRIDGLVVEYKCQIGISLFTCFLSWLSYVTKQSNNDVTCLHLPVILKRGYACKAHHGGRMGRALLGPFLSLAE